MEYRRDKASQFHYLFGVYKQQAHTPTHYVPPPLCRFSLIVMFRRFFCPPHSMGCYIFMKITHSYGIDGRKHTMEHSNAKRQRINKPLTTMCLCVYVSSSLVIFASLRCKMSFSLHKHIRLWRRLSVLLQLYAVVYKNISIVVYNKTHIHICYSHRIENEFFILSIRILLFIFSETVVRCEYFPISRWLLDL